MARYRSVLIGGSGSTGSSLLKNILNRNASIISGEETSLFCKKELYFDWAKNKHRIFTSKGLGLRNHAWHMFSGVNLMSDTFSPPTSQIKKWLNACISFQAFADKYYEWPLLESGADFWIEKTPSNAFCFKYFLNQFDTSAVIHLVRNPLDTIASLTSRGFTAYYASALYLLNTAAALSTQKNKDSIIIKYEDLVANSETTITELCRFLGVSFHHNMLISQNEKVSNSKLIGWQYDETRAIGQDSVGRFYKLDEAQQEDILNVIYQIRISKRGQDFFQTQDIDIFDIAQQLGYDGFPKPHKLRSIQSELLKDWLNRGLHLYPTALHYPIVLR